jgi:integrative and conjugative element protein (TIGR02256 family)
MMPLLTNQPLVLCSADGRFGLKIDAEHLRVLLFECQQSRNIETGGVLVGRYNPNHTVASVSEVTPPPKDSKHGRHWFDRGINGLSKKLSDSWRRERSFYLGEWHYHPGVAPIPSSVDSRQMASIANSPAYVCPEPILLIIGGAFPAWTVGAFVYEKGIASHPLSKSQSENQERESDGKPGSSTTRRR